MQARVMVVWMGAGVIVGRQLAARRRAKRVIHFVHVAVSSLPRPHGNAGVHGVARLLSVVSLDTRYPGARV